MIISDTLIFYCCTMFHCINIPQFSSCPSPQSPEKYNQSWWEVCVERQREIGRRDRESLRNWLMWLWALASLNSVRQAAGWRTREGLILQLKSKDCLKADFLFSRGPHSFFLKALNWWDEAHPHNAVYSAYSKYADLNIHHIWKQHLDWCLT